MLSSVRIGSSTRSVVMTFWYPRPVTSRSLGLLEVPAASSADGRWAPASQDAFSTQCLWSKQLVVGGQTLTYAICRSSIRGLDLFLTISSGFGLLGLGGWQVGQCCVRLEGWFLGRGLLWGWWLGVGVAVAGFGLCLMSLVDLMKQNQLYYYTSRAEQDIHYARKDVYLQQRLLHHSFLYSQGPWCLHHGTRCWWQGHTSWWRSACHGDGNRFYRSSRWVCFHLLAFGVGRRSKRTAKVQC
jgi:hypothetical protein